MRGWFSKPKASDHAAQEIDEEFAFHLDSAERDGRDAGLSEGDARAQARVGFGDVTKHRDACLRVARPWSRIMLEHSRKWGFAMTCIAIGFVLGVVVPSVLDDAMDALTGPRWQRVGAFEGVVWRADRPVVLVDNRWYTLESINGRSIDSFLEATEHRFGDRTRKRFKEDLYEVLQALGEPTDAIDATLRDVTTGLQIEKSGIELTQEKRDRAYSDDWQDRPGVPSVPTGDMISQWEEPHNDLLLGC